MAAINCKTYDTGEIVAEIRENRRYALASPSTVTGTPSLAMQSAAQMAVAYIYINDVKLSTPLTVSGTTKTPITINGANPSKEDLLSLSFEVTGITNGEVLYTTDEPNGAPTSPFAITTTPADLVTLAATGPSEIWVANPAVPLGRSRLWKNAAKTNYLPPPRELLFSSWRTPAIPIYSASPGVTTLQPIFASEIIPDYMLPDGIVFDVGGVIVAINGSGIAGALIGAGISGAVPTGAVGGSYPLSATVTPDGAGQSWAYQSAGVPGFRDGANFKNGAGDGRRSLIANTCGPVTSGANRGYVMVKSSSAADAYRIDGVEAFVRYAG